VRLPAEISQRSDQEKLARFLIFRELRDNRDSQVSKDSITENRRVRTTRRYFYNDRDPANYAGVLAKARAAVLMRRRPSFLQARSSGVAHMLYAAKEYNFPNQRQLTFVTTKTHAQQRTDRRSNARTAPYQVIRGARSILQYRTAKKRTLSHIYKADRILRTLPLRLGLAPRRAGRAGKKASSLLAKLESKRNNYLRLLRFAPVDKKEPYQILFTRAQRALHRAQNRLVNLRAEQAYSPTVLGSINQPPTFLKFGLSAGYPSGLTTLKTGTAPVSYNASTAKSSFRSHAFRYLTLQRRFTKRCMRLQAARRRMIFDTSRPRL